MYPQNMQEFNQFLKTKYPLTFYRYGIPRTEGGSCNFSCGKGWWPLIDALGSVIEQTNRRIVLGTKAELKERFSEKQQEINIELVNKEEIITATQIKEKFGGLRFYIYSLYKDQERIHNYIHMIEKASNYICEDCGQPGSACRPNEFWIKTLCKKCKVLRRKTLMVRK